MSAVSKRIAAAVFCLAALGCVSRFPDEAALLAPEAEMRERARGTLRLGRPATWAPQYSNWSGGGRFDGLDSAAGVSVRTNFVYPVLPLVVVVMAELPFLPWLNFPGGDKAKWLLGSGLLIGAIVDTVGASTGARGGGPYLGIPVGVDLRLFPEAGLDYSRHDAGPGDELHSLRWLLGFRLQPKPGKRRCRPYGRFGFMFSEMHFDVREDFTGRGPYAGIGFEWNLHRHSKHPDEPTELGAYIEAGAALLTESDGDDCTLFNLEIGLAFRW